MRSEIGKSLHYLSEGILQTETAAVSTVDVAVADPTKETHHARELLGNGNAKPALPEGTVSDSPPSGETEMYRLGRSKKQLTKGIFVTYVEICRGTSSPRPSNLHWFPR